MDLNNHPEAGKTIIRINIVGTALFSCSSVLAAVVFSGFAKTQGVIVDLALFACGTAVFLWGYWTAVQRSRSEEISVAELYLMMGGAISRRVKMIMNLCLGLQVLFAFATAIARLNTAGSGPGASSSAGSTLAFGVLVPVFGLGLNGLWASTHGIFPPRKRHTNDQQDDSKGL